MNRKTPTPGRDFCWTFITAGILCGVLALSGCNSDPLTANKAKSQFVSVDSASVAKSRAEAGLPPLPTQSPIPNASWSPSPDLSLQPHGKQTVVLLTSIDESTLPQFFLLQWLFYSNYEQRLESVFRDHFKNTAFNLEVHHGAGPMDVYQAMHSPDNVAVYWVSHATLQYTTSNNAVSIPAMIVDAQGYDVSSLFTEINPNIRWVSFVSCDSDTVISKLEQQSADLKFDKRVQLNGYNTEIDAMAGLKQSMTSSDPVIDAPAVTDGYYSPCITETGPGISLTRTLTATQDYPAVSVSMNEANGTTRIYGIFPAHPKGSSDLVQTLMIHYDAEAPLTSTDQLNISFNIGSSIQTLAQVKAAYPSFGSFQISAPWAGAAWKLFSLDGVTPIGITSNIYLYKGPLDQLAIQETALPYQPFDCSPMPSYIQLPAPLGN